MSFRKKYKNKISHKIWCSIGVNYCKNINTQVDIHTRGKVWQSMGDKIKNCVWESVYWTIRDQIREIYEM